MVRLDFREKFQSGPFLFLSIVQIEGWVGGSAKIETLLRFRKWKVKMERKKLRGKHISGGFKAPASLLINDITHRCLHF